MSALSYAGKAYRFTVDNGTVFENTYSPDGTSLRYVTVAGATQGATEEVDLQASEVLTGVFMLGWTETSGMSITHVMNLQRNTIHAFWTYPTADGPVGELHAGSIQQINPSCLPKTLDPDVPKES